MPPPALNNGQQVDLLLARIAAPYYGIKSFDELPTPFRCVAVDLEARAVRGHRARIAPARDARDDVAAAACFLRSRSASSVLVDGGAMNNMPGRRRPRAWAPTASSRSTSAISSDKHRDRLFAARADGETLDAMMRANTRGARRRRGRRDQRAAERVRLARLAPRTSPDRRRIPGGRSEKDSLLPLAVTRRRGSSGGRAAGARAAARCRSPAVRPRRGRGAADAELHAAGAAAVTSAGRSISAVIENQLSELGGLDRYETCHMAARRASTAPMACVVTARPSRTGRRSCIWA